MRYTTQNEFSHFTFHDVHIDSIDVTNDMFHMILDNVIILPENSCNRDIRNMRCNHLELRILESKVLSVVKEGYKIYDADGNLKEELPDENIDEGHWQEIFSQFPEGYAFSIEYHPGEDGGFVYQFVIDDEAAEHTYTLKVWGAGDMELWDRFLNIEE